MKLNWLSDKLEYGKQVLDCTGMPIEPVGVSTVFDVYLIAAPLTQISAVRAAPTTRATVEYVDEYVLKVEQLDAVICTAELSEVIWQ